MTDDLQQKGYTNVLANLIPLDVGSVRLYLLKEQIFTGEHVLLLVFCVPLTQSLVG